MTVRDPICSQTLLSILRLAHVRIDFDASCVRKEKSPTLRIQDGDSMTMCLSNSQDDMDVKLTKMIACRCVSRVIKMMACRYHLGM